MIEAKYGLKYSFPHSVVHIVDNSQYTGELPVVVAEDPSLLASIVVTGAPMGADRVMTSINRSDTLDVAYGMGNLSTDDIKRYGQSVTYPSSLIKQGGPVRLMRVTPDDATYAVSSLVVQWRIDGTDNKLHVRFKAKEWPEELQRELFKNTARVNEALIKYFKTDSAETDAQGSWDQRAFINFIAAGRGSAYNNMVNTIDVVSQSKRPTNVCYAFNTIDTRTNRVIEKFSASLINTYAVSRKDAITSVNTIVAKRDEGTSITVPYVNEAAVRELYNIYMNHYKGMLDITEPDEYTSNVYKMMNINIFDMIFGNYIYDGTDTSTKMPFYQVDMVDNDITKLDNSKIVCALGDTIEDISGNQISLWDQNNPTMLHNRILQSAYGITRGGDTVHVGDMYLVQSNGNNTNPKIAIITSINQYTGNVSSLTFPKVFPLDPNSGYKTLLKTKPDGSSASVPISILVSDITEAAGTNNAKSNTVKKLVESGVITDGAVIASTVYDPTTNNIVPGFDIYTVAVSSTTGAGGVITKTYTLYHMDKLLKYEMLDRGSHSGGVIGTGNAMGFMETYETDSAWNRPGATVYVQDKVADTSGESIRYIPVNRIYVNSYDRTASDDETDNNGLTRESIRKHRIPVLNAAVNGIIGTPPTSVNITKSLIGSEFDVKVYNNANIDKWNVSGISYGGLTGRHNSGSNLIYNVGDQFYIATIACLGDGSIEPGSDNDPEKYIITDTNDEAFVNWYSNQEGLENVPETFLNTAPNDWNTNYFNYFKYNQSTHKIIPVSPMELLTYKPENFNPVNYYKISLGNYVKGVSGDTWAENTWFINPSSSAPTFSASLKVLSDQMKRSWIANKSRFATSYDTSPCKTIVTVTSVDPTYGNITGLSISKATPYNNYSEANVLNVMQGNTFPTDIENHGYFGHFIGVYIPKMGGDVNEDTYISVDITNFTVVKENATPTTIKRYTITGSEGSLFRTQKNTVIIPVNYYSGTYGINPTSESGGIQMSGGWTGFFDDPNISDIEFKWRYSALLVKAFRGETDPRIQSPTRCPAKFIFDGAFNTIVGSTILPYVKYTPADIINASIIFTDDEKDEIVYHPEIIANLQYEDIDVKQAMYDLMVYRCYQGIPEEKRPEGPGSGFSLHLDSGITDANTARLVDTSFNKRFDNPNASWDIGGWNDVETGLAYTFTKQIADNLIRHSRENSINKPYVGDLSAITPDRYTSYFPDVDTNDWELRELLFNSGGNSWIMGPDGSLTRRAQRTLIRDAATSDLLQESNMRTLSQLTTILQEKIDKSLLDYNEDAVIKTLSDEINNTFSNWAGNLVQSLDITFKRDINIDGREILICNCDVTFRGLVLSVPIIVNVNRRQYT